MGDQILWGILGCSPATGDEYDRFTITLVTFEELNPTPLGACAGGAWCARLARLTHIGALLFAGPQHFLNR